MPSLGHDAGGKLHHIGNRAAVFHIHYHMRVVARYRPAQNGDPMALGTDPKPFPVLISFSAEPKKEPTIMAPMSQVVDETVLKIAR